MTLRKREHPDAAAELDAAIDWYRTPALRTKRVRGFPYRIVYLVEGDELVILAYPHDKQRPGYWRRRLNA